MTLTSTLLDGALSPVLWDLTEARLTLPLHGFWLAEVKTTNSVGQVFAPGANPAAGAQGQVPTSGPPVSQLDVNPPATLTYDVSGPLYDYSGASRLQPGVAPPWVYAGLSQYQPVTLNLGGVSFCGTVVRSGIWRNQVSLLVQAGVTQVGAYPGGGLNRIKGAVGAMLAAVAKAANATLSPLVATPANAALLTTLVDFQPSATLRLADTLDQLCGTLNRHAGPAWAARQATIYQNQQLWPSSVVPTPDLYHWRFQPDGTLFLGLDFWPSELVAGTAAQNPPNALMSSQTAAEAAGVTWLDLRAQQGLEAYGVTAPVLFPGDTYVGPQTPYSLPWPQTALVSLACAVEYHWSGTSLLMKVLNGAGSSQVLGVSAGHSGGQTGATGW